jgi:KipI family sensor histidine kinase inhibitor
MIALAPLGDRAALAKFATEAEAAAWASSVRDQGWPGVLDIVLAYQTVAVFANPDRIEPGELERKLRGLVPGTGDRPFGKRVRLPVLYDGQDLAEVARRLGLTEEEVIREHSGYDYFVFAIGFLPGFPYAGYLPEALSGLPRREPPRVQVPAGSVAIAGRQTGVYPSASPGGWYLLGRTPLRIVDVERGHFPIRAGDQIRFEPITPVEFEAKRGEWL